MNRTLSGLAMRLVAICAAVLGLGQTAQANTARPGHHCACEKLCRGAACCCSDDETASSSAPAPIAVERVEKTPAATGFPCLGTVPCGGGEVPSAPAGTSASKAALSSVQFVRLDPPTAAIVHETPTFPALISTSRLDDPPEGVL